MQSRRMKNWKHCYRIDFNTCLAEKCRTRIPCKDSWRNLECEVVDFSIGIRAETAVISYVEECTTVDKHSVFSYNTMIAETG